MTEKVIITSALQYINGVKHLGNLIGSLLPADVFTRYLKLIGKDVIYICGTDDHGTPAEISSYEAGKPVDEYCNEMYEVQKDIYERFGLKFDYFGRTHDQENHDITQQLFLGLKKNGYVLEKKSIQLFSNDDKRFLPDRYVIGTCPHCQYERARGDQCENCTTLLDPDELINPRSSISGGTDIEKREVTHFYIDLPKLETKISNWIDTQTGWPQTSMSIARKWLKEGLRQRSITRNLDWGIDLPIDGHDDKVFYVWFDAPIGYISMTKHWADHIVKTPKRFDEYWHDSSTEYYQFLGIDNVPFHSITFPGTILGYNEGLSEKETFNLTTFIKGFQWLTYETGKFSTSQNRGIFTDDALELYPADYWRYYLLLIAPERQNTDFRWDGFQNAVNNDLNNLLGNLVNRFLTFVHRSFNGIVPDGQIKQREKQLQKYLKSTLIEYRENFDRVEFQKPLKSLRALWQEGNRYFQEKQPWSTVKKEETLSDAASTVSILAHVLRSIAVLSAPFIPYTAENIFERLGLKKSSVHNVRWEEIEDWVILVGNKIPKINDNLFSKVADKEIDSLKRRYGSGEEDASIKVKDDEIIDYVDFAKVKMITAKILNVEDHPKAKKLLILTVDDGKRKDRTIVAGIRGHYEPTKLVGNTIVIVDNLKPVKLRGIKSEGMLLAAEGDDIISILQPIKKVNPGSKIK